MKRGLIIRLGLALFSIWGAVTIAFFLVHLVPGDPIDLLLGDAVKGADREALVKSLKLDEPVLAQYVHYWGKLFQGDMGTSFVTRQPIGDELPQYWLATVQLGCSAMVFSILIGVPFGILAALYRNSWLDRFLLGFSIAGFSIPSFWLAPVLIIFFSIKLNWLPAGDRESLASFVLPTISLGLGLSCVLARMTRNAYLNVLSEDFVRTAWAKGLSWRDIYLNHVLRNALVSIVTVISIQFAAVFTGVVVTETIYDWPGMGIWLYTSIQARDYPVVQACILVIALTYVTVNFLTDVLYLYLNPRMRA